MTESGGRPMRAPAVEPGTPGGHSGDAAGASQAEPHPGASADIDRDALDCIVLVELVTEYLEETLDPDLRRRVERHLGECPGCSIYIEQMRQTIRAVGRLAPADVPREAIAPLLAAFRAPARTATE